MTGAPVTGVARRAHLLTHCAAPPEPSGTIRTEEGRRMDGLEPLYARCCGLDIHRDTIVACLLTPGGAGRRAKEIRTFGTVTDEILALGDWLAEAGCTHVLMESTGVYWKPL